MAKKELTEEDIIEKIALELGTLTSIIEGLVEYNKGMERTIQIFGKFLIKKYGVEFTGFFVEESEKMNEINKGENNG